MLFQMLSPSVIAIVLAIGVAPEKALPALVAQAGENKNNAKAKEEKKIKVEFEENYVNVKGELALVGKISISSNIDSVYEEIMQEVKKRIIVVVIRDDLLKAMILNKEVEEKAELGKGINLEMVLIPAGKFIMGSPVSEKNHRKEETEHEVTLTKPYYMGKYEVTQEQWQEVMGNNPSKIKGAKLPVTEVSWLDCQEFIKKLNAKTNGGYRLPTEAEWEYACRAGTTTIYSFGDSLTKSDSNIVGNSIKAVGSYNPNAFGLYDMHGNVSEWCEDRYGDFPAVSATDPKGPETGKYRVLRGESFYRNVSTARSSNRLDFTPTVQLQFAGFRLVRKSDLKTTITPTVPKPDPAEVMPGAENLLVAPFTETKAKEVQKSVAKSLQKEVEEKEDLGKDVKLEMVLIPAGKFMMGSPASEKKRQNDETQHEVTLTKPYYMGKYEVTQEQWEEVMGKNPSSTKGAKLPVTDVSWEDSQDFIKKLNTKTSGGYRLPTEAEWEYACRAGTTTAYSYGDNLTKNDANIDGDSIKAVGGYKPNAFGLYDMHGNVWEWCSDVDDDVGSSRVRRGGSWYNDAAFCRTADRRTGDPPHRTYNYGFRLALSSPSGKSPEAAQDK